MLSVKALELIPTSASVSTLRLPLSQVVFVLKGSEESWLKECISNVELPIALVGKVLPTIEAIKSLLVLSSGVGFPSLVPRVGVNECSGAVAALPGHCQVA